MAKEKFAGEEFLLTILAKEPDALTSLELDILRARRTYLTDEQVVKYGLNETPAVEPVGESPVIPPPDVEVPVKAKKAKKNR